jgi:ribose-phosphate pyrophosphokinase
MTAMIDLSKGFKGNLGLKINTGIFPAGEVYTDVSLVNMEIANASGGCRINTRINSSDDLMTLLMTANALKERGVKKVMAFIPYFPYSRQDRACGKGESFSLRVICDIFTASDIDEITTYDIHSNVADILLSLRSMNNCKFYNNFPEVGSFVENAGIRKERLALICPDNGASKKIEELNKALPLFEKVVYCHKMRENGRVVYRDILDDLKGLIPVVVDDICDDNTAFLALSEKLQQAKSEQPYLFVSHGIFSNGLDELKKAYKSIGTTNSIQEQYEDNFISMFKLTY